MEMNCRILYELLKERIPIHIPPKSYENAEIRQILIFTGEIPRKNILYLVNDVKEHTEGLCLHLSEHPCQGWNVSCKNEDKVRIMNEILCFFQEFQQWREACQMLAEREHDLTGLLHQGVAFLPIQAYLLFDRYYAVLDSFRAEHFSSEDVVWTNHFSAERAKKRVIDLSDLQELYQTDPDFDQTFHTRGICAYPVFQLDTKDSCVYYCNLFQENYYIGRLVFLLPGQGGDNQGLLRLIDFLCSQLEICFQYQKRYRNQEHTPDLLENLLIRLLRKEPVDLQEAERLFALYQWKRRDRYQVFCLVPNGYFHSEQTMDYYMTQLRTSFPTIFCAQIEGNFYGLLNLNQDEKGDLYQKLIHFIRENLFKAGFSNVFEDFALLYTYRCQAEDALSLGNEKDASIWRYDFANYSFDYIRRQCLCQYPAKDLCPKNLQVLMEYDKMHPEKELLRTLYQYYICQFNGQQAAEKLFIHRTTFFYRMKKIRKIALFHPEDPRETSQIFLAFQLLEMVESRDQHP